MEFAIQQAQACDLAFFVDASGGGEEPAGVGGMRALTPGGCFEGSGQAFFGAGRLEARTTISARTCGRCRYR